MFNVRALQLEHLQFITEADELDKADELLSWCIRYQWFQTKLKITLFKLAGWVAIPIDPLDFDNQTFQEQLQQTLELHGYDDIYTWQVWSSEFYVYKTPVTLSSLCEYRFKLNSFITFLFAGEPEPSFVIVAIESDFYVLAGLEELIAPIFGNNIERAYETFQDRVDSGGFLCPRSSLQTILNELKDDYPQAEVGDEFIVDPYFRKE